MLQWTELVVTDSVDCRLLLQQISSQYDITDNMLCASDTGDHTERDACTVSTLLFYVFGWKFL